MNNFLGVLSKYLGCYLIILKQLVRRELQSVKSVHDGRNTEENFGKTGYMKRYSKSPKDNLYIRFYDWIVFTLLWNRQHFLKIQVSSRSTFIYHFDSHEVKNNKHWLCFCVNLLVRVWDCVSLPLLPYTF